MNWHMGKVLPGLYVGNYRDSKDHAQLERFKISHIIAIHDSPRRLLPDKHYLCVMASDTPDQNLSQYFSVCNDFIHAARLREGNVLIHCLAGMSRSVTVAVAYIMTATHLNWKEALKVVRAGRAVANPNMGFQTQLQEFEQFKLSEERRRLRERFPSSALEQLDRTKVATALDNYQELLQNRDICEGNCSRGEKCPTGASEDLDGDDQVEQKEEGLGSVRKNVAWTLSFAVDKWMKNTFDQEKNDLEEDPSMQFTCSEELAPHVRYYGVEEDKGNFVKNLDSDEDEARYSYCSFATKLEDPDKKRKKRRKAKVNSKSQSNLAKS
ncbi:dual specificity protein phosphatase 22 isoform X3 [Drosophila ficusphila]|uniref:dual specificity protein phosphatase 22 isoform X3 n=1 Tax=Drosophila ficusphila TaxID=30025 RepID=UPI0007E70D90|nr:dual specificity protein phosphatase 22 isoform X3 [Drosophila ficusphila]